MSHERIVRAWKDEEFRSSLSDDERALLPDHPAGLIELKDAELDAAAGGGCRLTTYGTYSSRGYRCYLPKDLV